VRWGPDTEGDMRTQVILTQLHSKFHLAEKIVA
jgi:hypothetical protein